MVVLRGRGLVWIAALGLALSFPAARQAAVLVDGTTLGVPGRSNSTPWVAAEGSFVVVAWGAAAAADSRTDVFVAVSRDGGRTFDAPVQVNKQPGEARLGGELPPRVALTRAAGSSPPEITALWTARGDAITIRTARSRDGGRTFDDAVVLQRPNALGDRGWPSLAVDVRGRPHAIWLDHRGLSVEPGSDSAHAAHRSAAARDGVAMAQKSGLYYTAAGSTPSSERQLTPGVCYCCKTALVAGRNGALAAAWRHVYPGNRRDIAFIISNDGGRTFAAPIEVSRDQWEIDGCPDDGPAMAVDAAGTIHIVWPTVIGGAEPRGAIFYSSTRDGRRFAPRVEIPTLGGPRPTHPQIAIDASGRVAVAWDEVAEGRRVAVVRELKRERNGVVFAGAPTVLSARGSAVYPVLAALPTGLIAVWTEGAPGAQPVIGVRLIGLP